jgi:dihydroorotase
LHLNFIDPMTILLRQVKITDPRSPHNGLVKDILIQDQVISSITENYKEKVDEALDLKGTSVSPGWVDPFVHFCDPGMEHRETLLSGATAAQHGGFTTVFALPNTNPCTDSKSQVSYILQQNKTLPIHVLPLGALSKKIEGKDLAEMIDMHQTGAIAFTDGLTPVQSTLLFLKSLQYVKAFDGVVIQMPIDKSWGSLGLMNEGIVSTKMGLAGIPAIAEELMIARDIELLKYTQSKLHITGVSTAKGIDHIRKAKKEGLSVTCSVTPYHLFFTEEDVQDYNTLLKVNPPLRTKTDQAALLKAIEDGTIDCISSHHMPQDWDAKTIEFENAKSGIASIETTFAALNHLLPSLSEDLLVKVLSINARSIFNTGAAVIKEGEIADFTFYSKSEMTQLNRNDSKSKSANSPFWNVSLTGKVKGTFVKGSATLF